MKFRLVLIFTCLIYFFSGSHNIYASSDFSTTYDQTYRINSDDSILVSQIFTITNLSSRMLANKSVLFLPYQDVTDISASDLSGPLKMTVDRASNGVNLTVDFNNPAAGIGHKYSWFLSFITRDLVKKYGQIVDIILPDLNLEDPVSDYTVRLIFNNVNYGVLSYVWPDSAKLEWSKSVLGNKSVHLIFSPADTQFYNVSLKYLLKNKKLYPQTLEIPLFSNTVNQTISITSLTPRPLDVVTSDTGVWKAKYYLGPTSTMEVSSELKISSKFQGTQSTAGSLTSLNFPHLNPGSHSMQDIAKKLGSIEQIYRYTITNFKADSSCLSEVSLFSDMAASLGIPARNISGFLYPDNNHLHCWAEFYDEKTSTWHQVDPQMEISMGADNFNKWDPYHLILDVSPAGIPFSGIPLEKIDFKPSLEPLSSESAHLTYEADFPNQVFSGLNFSGKVTINNDSGVEFPNLAIVPTAQFLKPKSERILVGSLPPYARRVIPVEFAANKDWTFAGNDIISLVVEGQAYSYQVRLLPVYESPIVILAGGIIIVFIAYTFTKISRGVLFQRRKGTNSLHR